MAKKEQKNQKIDFDKIYKERIKFYAETSHERDVQMNNFEVLQHPSYEHPFLHLEYIYMGDGFIECDEIEIFTADAGWVKISNQMTSDSQKSFLQECKKLEYDLKGFEIFPKKEKNT